MPTGPYYKLTEKKKEKTICSRGCSLKAEHAAYIQPGSIKLNIIKEMQRARSGSQQADRAKHTKQDSQIFSPLAYRQRKQILNLLTERVSAAPCSRKFHSTGETEPECKFQGLKYTHPPLACEINWKYFKKRASFALVVIRERVTANCRPVGIRQSTGLISTCGLIERPLCRIRCVSRNVRAIIFLAIPGNVTIGLAGKLTAFVRIS